MKRKIGLPIITALVVAVATPATGQQQHKNSSGSHVLLIARIPETLHFAVNEAASPDSVTGPEQQGRPQVASSISTSWVLAKGRDRVDTLARVNRPLASPLIALAAPTGLPGYSESTAESFAGFHLPIRPLDQISRLDSLTITDANLAATNTICLSDSMDPEKPPLPEAGYAGTMKIQVQALP
jgi:hypothetical protein